MFAFLQISRSETAQKDVRNFAEDGDVDYDLQDEQRSRAGESMLEDDADYDAESSYGDSNIEEEAVDAQWSITVLEDGKMYVNASRNVIKGTTVAEMRRDITNFFNDLLEEKPSLDIQTIEGDVLTITKADTADKARDDHKIVAGKRVKMTDQEFAVKLRVESHIDEVAEISRKIGSDGDHKNHTIARDGFTYRKSYFEDFDGQYYEIILSIGNNGTVATVYNVGKIEEGVPPSANIIAGVGSKPLGGTPSKSSISQTAPSVKEKLSESRAGESMLEDDAGYDAESSYGDSNIEEEAVDAQWSISRADESFKKAEVNDNIMEMIARVKAGDYRDNDKVYLGRVSDETAAKIKEITGIDVRGFKVAIEARQVKHILKYHGENGITNQSLRDDELIARMEYAIREPDTIQYAGKAQGYSYEKNGHSKTADTVLYEKSVGEKSYYVVQAVADTKKKTLFVVTAFIGDKGYKTGTPQIADAKSPDETSKNAAAEVPTESISQSHPSVKEKLSVTRTAKEQDAIMAQMRSILQNGGTAADLRSYVDTLDAQERAQAKKKPQGTNTQRRGDAASQIVRAAHDAEMSVEEYLRENAELYETEDGWNKDARRALQMEENGRGVKYSISKADIEVLREIPNKSVNAFTSTDIKKTEKWAKKFYKELGTKSPFFRAWFGDWRAYDTEQVSVVEVPVIDISEAVLEKGTYDISDVGWKVHAGKILNDDTRHHSGGGRVNVKALGTIKEILKNAVLLDTVVSEPDTKKKSENTAFLHKFYTMINYGGELYIAKSTVEEYYNEANSGISRRAYNLKAIKIEPVGGQLGITSSSSRPVTDSIISIADLFDVVKRYDTEFDPKPVNKVRLNEDGTPKVFYHGTDAKFTEFRPEEMAHREGSFFFAENREDAEAYGRNVLEVYLTGENLADYDNQPREFYQLRDKRAQVQYLEDRGYDGWYADMDSDGWGELSVFSPTQIKSATDNIGTFDGENPDIRYSISGVHAAGADMEALARAKEMEKAGCRGSRRLQGDECDSESVRAKESGGRDFRR